MQLKKDIANKTPGRLYAFYGEERYLLEYYLGMLRKVLIPEGLEGFNAKRFEGKNVQWSEIAEAIDALPVFCERTLIEVYDFDLFKRSEAEKNEILQVFSDLPDYVCVVFVYDIVEFKPDGRVKINSAIKNAMSVVEFVCQEQSDLVNWIGRRFKALGKRIDRSTAEYLSFVSGGLMTTLTTEIEKTAAYAKGEIIQKSDVDAVVVPVLDAAVYKMTDAMLQRDFNEAARILGDLLAMQEPPHKILYNISIKMRQLLAAKLCVLSEKGMSDLMDICSIRYEFQAKGVMAAARRTDESWCRGAVRLCSETAYKMNSGTTDEKELLSQLLMELAVAEDSGWSA